MGDAATTTVDGPKGAVSDAGIAPAPRGIQLSEEQLVEYDKLRRWLDQRAIEAEEMTPDSSRQADAEWKAFEHSLNDERRAGARLIYIDDE